MASGDPIAEVLRIAGPRTSRAAFGSIGGGSTPAEDGPMYRFPASVDTYLEFKIRLSPNYGNGGVTNKIPWSASTATTGNVVWEIAIRRLQADLDALSSAHTYVYQSVTDAAPSALTEHVEAELSLTNGTQMDDLAAGEIGFLRLRRKGTDAGDTMAGDAEFWADDFAVRET